MPMFKDALLFRRIYNKAYGNITPPLVSKYWVPQWVGENPDSSARKIDTLFDHKDELKKMQNDKIGRDATKLNTSVNMKM
jgi:hypothetical protein